MEGNEADFRQGDTMKRCGGHFHNNWSQKQATLSVEALYESRQGLQWLAIRWVKLLTPGIGLQCVSPVS